jgi:Tol biopolymer transport system component
MTARTYRRLERTGTLHRGIGPLAIAGITALLAAAAPASATAPGHNGQIAFRRIVNPDVGTSPIFVRSPHGAGPARQLTHPGPGVEDTQPDWSANGELIAFQRCAPDTVCASYTVRPDGTQLTRLTPPCDAPPPDIAQCVEEVEVAFMPDSRRVVYTRFTGGVRTLSDGQYWIRHSDLVIRNLHTRRIHIAFRGAPFSGDNQQVVASPDGTRLAFERVTSPLGHPASSTAVFVVGVDGRHLHRITPWALDAGDHPDWSPDGRWILFRSNESGDFLNSQLYVVHPDGSGLHRVTHLSPDTLLLSASFSPDGKRIVYAQSGTGGLPDIFTMKTDGTHRRQVTSNRNWDSAPDWGPKPSGRS